VKKRIRREGKSDIIEREVEKRILGKKGSIKRAKAARKNPKPIVAYSQRRGKQKARWRRIKVFLREGKGVNTAETGCRDQT